MIDATFVDEELTYIQLALQFVAMELAANEPPKDNPQHAEWDKARRMGIALRERIDRVIEDAGPAPQPKEETPDA